MVVGWAIADHMHASLVTGALAMARDRGHPPRLPSSIPTATPMHLPGNGRLVHRQQCPPVHGATGVCWDNAVAESAFSSLKTEFYHHSFATRQGARRASMRYIEVFYNRWRHHTNKEGLSPATAMANFKAKTQPLTPAA
ncbi:IS3 family transposase [uncultured Arthrobacter sp.]|uniref:IS3 family transposase n=1 Tax=uncultured Arthrobacter sp. TaxID=114050 RepID=UPI0032177649